MGDFTYDYKDGVLKLQAAGHLVVDENFQNDVDNIIASLSIKEKVKLLVLAPDFYSIDNRLRKIMSLPGAKAPVKAIALINPDVKWNEANYILLKHLKLPFSVRFFSNEKQATEWLISAN